MLNLKFVQKPLFPSEETINSNAIAKELITHLSNSAWALPFVTSQGKVEEDNNINTLKNDIKTYSIDSNNSISTDSSKGVVASRKPIINTSNMNNNINSSSSSSITSSSSNSSLNSINNNSNSVSIDMSDPEEEEDDKYRKRNLTQLLTALGFM